MVFTSLEKRAAPRPVTAADPLVRADLWGHRDSPPFMWSEPVRSVQSREQCDRDPWATLEFHGNPLLSPGSWES